MIDQNRVDKIIEERKAMHPNDPRIEEKWEELTCIFSENEESTIAFLNDCNEEYLYWISEVFEDISAKLQSREYIVCLRKLDEKYPDLHMTVDVDFAEREI